MSHSKTVIEPTSSGHAVVMRAKLPTLSVVVPCYNEEEALPLLLERLAQLGDELVGQGDITDPMRIVLVDDGSRDRTWEVIVAAAETGAVTGIRLSGNCGHQRALLAGLTHADSDLVVSMDADLQDDPSVVGRMVEAWRQGAEIVFGVRSSRDKDTVFKRNTARAYYKLLARLGVKLVPDHADFRLMSRKALAALSEFSEVNLFLRGMVPMLGFKTAKVEYGRDERVAGNSKYPLVRMLGLAIEGVTSFSIQPLRMITVFGFLVALGSFALIFWSLIAWFAGRALPGWASTVVPIYLLGGVHLIALGVIGEYIGKIYSETKRRPRFIVDEIVTGSAPVEPNRQ